MSINCTDCTTLNNSVPSQSPVEVTAFVRNFKFAVSIVIIIIIPIIIVPNALVIASVAVFRRLRHHNNYLLCSLACADLVVGGITCPFYIGYFMEITPFLYNHYVCDARYGSLILGCNASLYNLFIIVLDRYVAIIHPFYYIQVKSARKLCLTLSIMWLYTFIMSAIPLMYLDSYNPNKRCNFFDSLPWEYVLWVWYISIGICVTVPLILYIKIYYVIQKHKRQIRSQEASMGKCEKKFQNAVQFTQISAIVFVIFVALWIPQFVQGSLKLIKVSQNSRDFIQSITLLLAFSNSMVNPIVYVLVRSDFRNAFTFLLTVPVWRWSELTRHSLTIQATVTRGNSFSKDELRNQIDLANSKPAPPGDSFRQDISNNDGLSTEVLSLSE